MGDIIVKLSPKVLDIDEAAAYLSISVGVFRKYVLPEIHQIKLSARRRGYLVSDLDKWLENKTDLKNFVSMSNPWDSVF